jgi:hypothetical protein
LVECHIDDSRHILTKEPSGLEDGKAPHHFRPEVTVIVLACSLPGATERLTGEPSTDKVNCGDVSPVDRFDVAVTGYGWPMLA